jgi:hypothetical protein
VPDMRWTVDAMWALTALFGGSNWTVMLFSLGIRERAIGLCTDRIVGRCRRGMAIPCPRVLGRLQRVDPNGHRGFEFVRSDRSAEKQRSSGPI